MLCFVKCNMAIKCVLLVLCYHFLLGSVVSEFTPTVYPAKILSSSQCGQSNPLHDQQLTEALKQIQQQLPIRPAYNTSCKNIHCADPSARSGYYSIRATNGSTVQVYCDMEGTNCGGKGGWTRVAYVNMSQPGATCPQGLIERRFTEATLCGRNRNYPECNGTVFPTPVEYSQVCGQVLGYQFAHTTAFGAYYQLTRFQNRNLTIDEAYVDGVSITYGSTPRKHVWTYASGAADIYGPASDGCPCSNNPFAIIPPYVGSDYYCESGATTCCPQLLYFNDPLWDGKQCGGMESPCCTHPNMPWFLKTLSETTTADLELRLCGDYNTYRQDDTPLGIIELYIR